MNFTRPGATLKRKEESFSVSAPRKKNLFTNRPLPFAQRTPAAERTRRRRCGAGGRQQTAGMVDWPHPKPIGVEGAVGEAADERQRRRPTAAAAGERIPATAVSRPANAWHGELQWMQRKAPVSLVGHGTERRGELHGGATTAAAEARELRRRRGGAILWASWEAGGGACGDVGGACGARRGSDGGARRKPDKGGKGGRRSSGVGTNARWVSEHPFKGGGEKRGTLAFTPKAK